MMNLGQGDEIRDYYSVSFKQIKNSWVKRFVDKNSQLVSFWCLDKTITNILLKNVVFF